MFLDPMLQLHYTEFKELKLYFLSHSFFFFKNVSNLIWVDDICIEQTLKVYILAANILKNNIIFKKGLMSKPKLIYLKQSISHHQ